MSIAKPASGRPFRDAAEKYRASGFLGTLPLPPGEKNPPPKGFTGSGRPDPTNEQVRAWRRDNGDGNIALRLAEVPHEVTNKRDLPFAYAGNNVDGWELLGIDVDDYKGKHGLRELRELEAEHGPLPPTAMSTARWAGWDEHRSAIRVFLVPKGYRFMGKAAPSIDIVQKRHRFMVAAPSTNPDADGVQYEWRYCATDSTTEALREFDGGLPNVATGDVALLPESWFAHLSRGGTVESDDAVSGLSDVELNDWLETLGYDAEPCERMRGAVAKWLERLDESASSHDKLFPAHNELLNLAAEGHAGIEWALNQFHPAWWAHVSANRGGDPETASAEINRSITGALDKIQPGYKGLGRPEDTCAVDTGRFDCDGLAARLLADDGAAVDEFEAFWSTRPELTRLRQFARARLTGPWSTFGAVLARAVATIPPSVVLPPTVGDHASVNLFVALVAPSGFGKGASEAVAEAFLDMAVEPFVATPGSGEGLLKQYAYKKRPRNQDPEQVNLRNSAIFTVPEVDTFAALSGRSGATLMPELRKAWMGERLGFGYADAEKAVAIMAHRYRMTMVVGVQPGRGGTLLHDTDGGTPQRFLWLPTTDPDAPDDPPEEPERWKLSAWPAVHEPVADVTADPDTDETNESGARPKFAVAKDFYRLEEPAQRSAFHVLDLPPTVSQEIRAEHLAKRRGDTDGNALDSHAMLARLKVAVGLMWLNGRTDKINEEDWSLAGTVLAVSNATRSTVLSALSSNATKAAEARGRQDAVREVVKEDVLRDRKIARLSEGIRKKLRAENDQPINKLSKQFRGPDRALVRPTLELLQEVGDVELRPIEYQGNTGEVAHLKERQ